MEIILFDRVKLFGNLWTNQTKMCYDLQAQLEAQLKRAKRDADEHAIREIRNKLARQTDLPLYHSMGFDHPKMFIYTKESPNYPIVAQWGLIPEGTFDKKDIWNKTLNARGEAIFKLPSFRNSAKEKRCLVYIDGFFEHHHHGKETYPYFISRKDGKPMILAGLWNEWQDPVTDELLRTFTIVTTVGNPMMGEIHNNPKLKGPRMPLILPDDIADEWIFEEEREKVEELISSFPETELEAYTVGKLRGKHAIGNHPEAIEVFEYENVKEQY